MEVALASLNFGNAERARLLSMAPSGPSLIGSLGLPPPPHQALLFVHTEHSHVGAPGALWAHSPLWRSRCLLL